MFCCAVRPTDPLPLPLAPSSRRPRPKNAPDNECSRFHRGGVEFDRGRQNRTVSREAPESVPRRSAAAPHVPGGDAGRDGQRVCPPRSAEATAEGSGAAAADADGHEEDASGSRGEGEARYEYASPEKGEFRSRLLVLFMYAFNCV